MELLRVTPAAKHLGVHPDTIRRWAKEGKLPMFRVGSERRFSVADLDRILYGGETRGAGREALYLRVSGTSGQETSLAAQEQELRATAQGPVVVVFRDRASGLREQRPGLTRLLQAATAGKFEVVRVTHEDRLARFGAKWITALLARDQVEVRLLHSKGQGGSMDELLADFMALVASFAGRMYGIRGKEARSRLLNQAQALVAGSENE